MSGKLIRIYKMMDVKEVKEHLMIYGDISASCANCQAIDLKITDKTCPKCQAEFKYISFRKVGTHIPKMVKLSEEQPKLVLVDFEDYQRNLGALKAEEFLK